MAINNPFRNEESNPITAAVSGLFGVLGIHLIVVGVAAFIYYDPDILHKGFAFGEWSVLGRGMILIPYVTAGAVRATMVTTGHSFKDVIAKLKPRKEDES